MKAKKIRLCVTMITLAAVTIAITIPAQAQRRSTSKNSRSSELKEPERNRDFKRTVEKKSTFKDYDKVRRTSVNSNLKSTRDGQRKSAPTKTRSSQNQNRNSTIQSNRRPSNSRTPKSGLENTNRTISSQYKSKTQPSSNRINRDYTDGRTKKSELNRNTTRGADNRKYSANKVVYGSRQSAVRRTPGTSVSNSRSFYRVDKKDKRYTTNSRYKGGKTYWTNNCRASKAHYKHNNSKYYGHKSYNKYNHWDRSWERYRWNYSSWNDYYRGYQMHSYMYHNNYYHHKHYGHVIRRFDYHPQVFVHNHRNYYNYNGHFFRYRMGVGYVLVDIPFGLAFEYLPKSYERVYINGFMYFRVGNLFFEWANHGFRLVHYPERYYAYDAGYNNNGYRFNDDYYYEDNY